MFLTNKAHVVLNIQQQQQQQYVFVAIKIHIFKVKNKPLLMNFCKIIHSKTLNKFRLFVFCTIYNHE